MRHKKTPKPKSKNPAIANDPTFRTALSLLASGKLHEAQKTALTLVARFPESAECLNLCATIQAKLGQIPQADASFQDALKRAPQSTAVKSNYSQFLRDTGRLEQALKLAKSAARKDPTSPAILNTLGTIQLETGHARDAMFTFKKAIKHAPNSAQAHANLGNVFRAFGQKQDAQSSYQKAISIQPKNTEFQYNLALVSDDPGKNLAKLQSLDADLSDPRQRLPLHFALANTLDQIGDHKAAYTHFSRANAIGADLFPFDSQHQADLFSQAANLPLPSQNPDPMPMTMAFIIGMPRSGSTLLEHLLSAHPHVSALGEVTCLSRLVPQFLSDPANLTSLTATRALLSEIRASYTKIWRQSGAKAHLCIDKMPFNFRWLGIIQMAFPDARIIHMTRSIDAVCWSNFRHRFSSVDTRYSWSMPRIFDYYRAYLTCMSAWRERLDQPMLDLNYETLIAHPTQTMTRLQQFCDLPLNSTFAGKKPPPKRAITTASSNQVRQGLYHGSSQKWQSYRAELERDHGFSAHISQLQNQMSGQHDVTQSVA